MRTRGHCPPVGRRGENFSPRQGTVCVPAKRPGPAGTSPRMPGFPLGHALRAWCVVCRSPAPRAIVCSPPAPQRQCPPGRTPPSTAPSPISVQCASPGGRGSYRPTPSSPRLHRRRLFPRSSVTMLEKRGMSPFFHFPPGRVRPSEGKEKGEVFASFFLISFRRVAGHLSVLL